jgi:oligosaccharide repeat unit polymerase
MVIFISVSLLFFVFLTSFLLLKKNYVISSVIAFINIPPVISLIASTDDKFINIYPIILGFVLCGLCIAMIVPKNKIKNTENFNKGIVCKHNSKLKFTINKIGLLAFFTMILFIPSIYSVYGVDYLSFHRGEHNYGSALSYTYKLVLLVALFIYLSEKFKVSNYIYYCVLLVIPQMYFFSAGFRSPLITQVLAAIMPLIYHFKMSSSDIMRFALKPKIIVGLLLIVILFATQGEVRRNQEMSLNILNNITAELVIGASYSNTMIELVDNYNADFGDHSLSLLRIIINDGYPGFITVQVWKELSMLIKNKAPLSFSENINALNYFSFEDGGGAAGSIIADLYYSFGWFMYVIFLLFILALLYIDYLLAKGVNRKILFIGCLYIVPQLSIIWRKGIYDFTFYDYGFVICLSLIMWKSNRTFSGNHNSVDNQL